MEQLIRENKITNMPEYAAYWPGDGTLDWVPMNAIFLPETEEVPIPLYVRSGTGQADENNKHR